MACLFWKGRNFSHAFEGRKLAAQSNAGHIAQLAGDVSAETLGILMLSYAKDT